MDEMNAFFFDIDQEIGENGGKEKKSTPDGSFFPPGTLI